MRFKPFNFICIPHLDHRHEHVLVVYLKMSLDQANHLIQCIGLWLGGQVNPSSQHDLGTVNDKKITKIK